MTTVLATPPPWAPANGYREPECIPEPGTPVLLSITLLYLLTKRRR